MRFVARSARCSDLIAPRIGPGVARSGTGDLLRSEPRHSERHAAQILSVEERHVEHIKNDVLGAGGVTATTQSYRLEIAFIDLRTKGPLMAAAFEIPHSSHRNCLTPKPPRLTRCGE